MIEAYFVTNAGLKRRLEHAPGTVLRLHRNELHWHPDHPPAVHRELVWYLEGKACHVFKIHSPVLVHFERDGEKSAAYGPLTPVVVVEGMVFLDGEEEPIGDLVNNELWVDRKTNLVWTDVVFSETGAHADG